MFYCVRTEHPNEESARNEAKRLSETVWPEYDRIIEHDAYVCVHEHFGKWHVRVTDPSLAKEARQAKLNARKNRSHYKNNGMEKRGYNSMREAEAQARTLELKEGSPMVAYQCAECHLWHVGHAESSEVMPRINNERLEAEQRTIGYSVKSQGPINTPSMPVRVASVAPAPPVNRFAEAAAKLQRTSEQIATAEVNMKLKTEESNRLMGRSMALFDQAADAENQGKTLASEAQTLVVDIAELKGQAQAIMRELNQAFAA